MDAIIPTNTEMEDTTNPIDFLTTSAIYVPITKAACIAAHKRYLESPKQGLVICIDGSRITTNSAGSIITSGADTRKVVHQEFCKIGQHTDILDAEIHAVRERIDWAVSIMQTPPNITLCIDNHGALRALAGGGSRVK